MKIIYQPNLSPISQKLRLGIQQNMLDHINDPDQDSLEPDYVFKEIWDYPYGIIIKVRSDYH